MNKQLVLLLLTLFVFSTSTQAIEISKGELTGSFDTTISYGAALRAGDLDEDYVGKVVLNPFVGGLDNAAQRAAPGRWSVNKPLSLTCVIAISVFSPVLWGSTILKIAIRIFCQKRRRNVLARMSGYWICMSGPNMRLATAS